jgi:hypothetical protein
MNSRRLITFVLQDRGQSLHTDERERHFPSPKIGCQCRVRVIRRLSHSSISASYALSARIADISCTDRRPGDLTFYAGVARRRATKRRQNRCLFRELQFQRRPAARGASCFSARHRDRKSASGPLSNGVLSFKAYLRAQWCRPECGWNLRGAICHGLPTRSSSAAIGPSTTARSTQRCTVWWCSPSAWPTAKNDGSFQ